MSHKWLGLERPITLAQAQAELPADRLFAQPARRPSPATVAALAQARRQPPIVAEQAAPLRATRTTKGTRR
jgi:hypothetical protein